MKSKIDKKNNETNTLYVQASIILHFVNLNFIIFLNFSLIINYCSCKM